MMIHRKVLLVLFGSFLLTTCGIEEPESLNLIPPEIQAFPKCNLIGEYFQASYGITESYRREYDDGRLVSQSFDYDNQVNSFKEFIYNAQGLPELMLSVDSTNVDTLATYSYENGFLVNYRHLKPGDGRVLDTRQYFYENEHLRSISVFNDSGHMIEMHVKTDKRGNPTLLSYEIEGKTVEIHYDYDENPNPYFKMPDFIEESRYFAQNNLVRTISYENGEEIFTGTKTYAYFDNGLPSRIIEIFSQGTHSVSLLYECDS